MPASRFLLALLLAFVLSLSAPSPARADGFLEFFFPSLKKKEYDPTATGVAEFANTDQVINAPSVEEGLPENATPINVRHRPSSDIAKWVESTLPELLSYNADLYKEQYKKKVLLFNTSARAEYLKNLHEKNFLKTLDTGNYDINAFVEEIPLIMNEGEVEGRYRWLYKTKVMVTYVSKGATDYKLVKEGETVTQSMYATIQVGRLKTADLPVLPEGMENPHGLIIESFDIKLIKAKASQKPSP